jgi:uncharacterized membrane protein SirB2
MTSFGSKWNLVVLFVVLGLCFFLRKRKRKRELQQEEQEVSSNSNNKGVVLMAATAALPISSRMVHL